MINMKKIGNSGLHITEITFGSALTIGTENCNIKYAEQLIGHAWDLGIRSFDTSNNYGMGNAELLVGEALKKYPRDEYVLATKGSWAVGESLYHKGLSRKHILWAFEESIARLKHEYIDIYYAHRYDPDVPMEEIVRTFNSLINAGKIRYWATSEWPVTALEECHRICDKFGFEKPILDQFIYSYAINKAAVNGVKDFCIQNKVGMLGFSPLAQGLLTGKYADDIPKESRIAKSKLLNYEKTKDIYEQTKYLVDHFVSICKQFGIKGSHAAIQWVIRQGVLPVLGASSTQQLTENVEALTSQFPNAFWSALNNKTEDI